MMTQKSKHPPGSAQRWPMKLMGSAARYPSYSLQKGPPAAELKALKNPPVIDLVQSRDDFADAAGVVAELDLVIMTDSAVAHLAGAMGKPVWLLLNRGPYWIWGSRPVTTAWYASLHKYTQTEWNDWQELFDQCSDGLMHYKDARLAGRKDA